MRKRYGRRGWRVFWEVPAWFVVLSVPLVSGCRPPRPPVPTPPPVRTVAVVDAGGLAVGPAYVDDTGGGHTCQLAAGYCEVLQSDAPAGQTFVTVEAEGFEPYRQDAVTLPPGNVQIWLGEGCGMPDVRQCVNLPPLVPVFRPLPRVVVNGFVFSTEEGERWSWVGASDFDLYRQFLADEASITPITQQRAGLGFNVLRVFGSFAGALGRFVPTDYGELYYTRLPGFADALAREGMRLGFVVFADTIQWLPNAQDQIRHFNRVVAALTGKTNVFVEVVNEADQTINRTDGLQSFGMPASINSSHGSNGALTGGLTCQPGGNSPCNWPVWPYWHWVGVHFNDQVEWWRKTGHNCAETAGELVALPWRGPCVADENTRPDRDGNLAHFYDAAAGAALLAAGSTFHSESGKASRWLEGQDLEAALQWIAGARSVPLACQSGPYVHRQDLEGSTYLRVYQRGTDPACIVRIRP